MRQRGERSVMQKDSATPRSRSHHLDTPPHGSSMSAWVVGVMVIMAFGAGWSGRSYWDDASSVAMAPPMSESARAQPALGEDVLGSRAASPPATSTAADSLATTSVSTQTDRLPTGLDENDADAAGVQGTSTQHEDAHSGVAVPASRVGEIPLDDDAGLHPHGDSMPTPSRTVPPMASSSTTGSGGNSVREWAGMFHPVTLDMSVLKQVFQDLPSDYFGALGRIAQTGRTVKGRTIDEYDVPKALIKEFRALANRKGGLPPPALSWLWKQLGDAVREGDESFRDFFSKILVSTGLLERVDHPLTEEGYTNLHLAVMAGDAAVVNVIILAGANVNLRSTDPTAVTSLHLALDRWSEQQQRGHGKACTFQDFHAVVMRLATHPGVDVAAVDGDGLGLVHKALAARHLDGAKALLSRASNPASLINTRLPMSNGTALHTVVDCSTMLVTGAKWTTWHRQETDAANTGCVHDAVAQYNISKAKVLRRPTRHHDRQAVASVVQRWNQKFVNLVLDAGANVSAVDASGATALHVAASRGNTEAVAALLRAGADAKATDANGNRPYTHARQAGFVVLGEVLAAWAGIKPKTVRSPRQHSRERASATAASEKAGWGPARTVPLLPNDDLAVATCDFDVRSNLTVEEFRKEYWALGKPVLIQGGLLGLPAQQLERWGRDRITKRFGDLVLQVARVRSNQSAETHNGTFSQYTKYMDSHTGKLRRSLANASQSSQMIVEARWAEHEQLHRSATSLLQKPSAAGWLDAVAVPLGWRLHNYQINCGAPICGTQLHYHFATMSSLIHGAKRWVLYPPAEAFFSSAHFKEDFTDILAGRLGSPLQCTQLGGDVMYIPSLWGHGALYDEFSFSISFLYDYNH